MQSRNDFKISFAGLAMVSAVLSVRVGQSAFAGYLTKDYTLHFISHSHIDMNWLWG